MNWNSLFNNTGKSDLKTVKQIYRGLNLDTKKIKIISVVGTNGKGSTSNFIAQGLIKNNHKVGLFTSPHIIKPNERIKINDAMIKDEEIFKILQDNPQFQNLHFFSTMFLVAMKHFVDNKVDVIILEAGVGGLKDSTNAVKADIGVLTSIALDHEKYLGNTLESIAKDKSGIINRGMIFYLPIALKSNLKEIFINKVLRTKSASFMYAKNEGATYSIQNKRLAAEVLLHEFNIQVNIDDFIDLKGRSEIVKTKDSLKIYDVAHNLAGIKASLYELKQKGINFDNVVLCLGKQKNKEGITSLFKNKKLYIYQLNDKFYSAKELGAKSIDDPRAIKGDTLYIGSFYFIGSLWKDK